MAHSGAKRSGAPPKVRASGRLLEIGLSAVTFLTAVLGLGACSVHTTSGPGSSCPQGFFPCPRVVRAGRFGLALGFVGASVSSSHPTPTMYGSGWRPHSLVSITQSGIGSRVTGAVVRTDSQGRFEVYLLGIAHDCGIGVFVDDRAGHRARAYSRTPGAFEVCQGPDWRGEPYQKFDVILGTLVRVLGQSAVP